MPSKCLIKGCKARKDSITDLSLFNLPTDPDLRALWLKAANHDGNFKSKRPQICSVHFRPEDFVSDLMSSLMGTSKPRRMLTPGAVPTLFMPGITAEAEAADSEAASSGPPVKIELNIEPKSILPQPRGGRGSPHKFFSIEEHEKILNDKVPRLLNSDEFVYEPLPKKNKNKAANKKKGNHKRGPEDEKVMYYVYRDETDGVLKKSKYDEPMMDEEEEEDESFDNIQNDVDQQHQDELYHQRLKPPTSDREVQVDQDDLHNKALKRALAQKNAEISRLKRENELLKRRQRQLLKELVSSKVKLKDPEGPLNYPKYPKYP